MNDADREWEAIKDSLMPVPPYPDRESPLLATIVRQALDDLHNGRGSVKEAILYAAVHGWYEGHIEGEERCLGCDYRGELG